MKLYLKGERCFTEKCAIEKRNTPPGLHGRERRRKPGGYAEQIRAKQRMRRVYGVLERQFRNVFEKAERLAGKTGENLVVLLERRLDPGLQPAGLGRPARAGAPGRQSVPSWLEVDRENFRARLIALPKREELTTPPLNEQLVVELYSK